MPNRVNDYPLPKATLLDLRTPAESGFSHGALHRKLALAIQEALDDDGQVILFLNRRGFSTRIQCPACGEVIKCPNCDIPLTHHRIEKAAICHYCDYETPIPRRCPGCGHPDINFRGFGTQRLEKELATRFDTPILRMDMDTMRGRGAHEKALTSFRNGEYKILLGTQMIAKGLDFPNVLLVGVISADTSLYHPDFRASERTFHLITQVAGRTGRGERGGRVLVQTYAPDHPAIRAAAGHDYHSFVKGELENRKRVGYPPPNLSAWSFGEKTRQNRWPRLTRDAPTEKPERDQRQKRHPTPLPASGPAPAIFPKLRGFWRWHIHVHSRSGRRCAKRSVIRSAKKSTNRTAWNGSSTSIRSTCFNRSRSFLPYLK